MDNSKIEKKLDKVIKKANNLMKRKVWEVAPLIEDLESIKGDIITDDVVRTSGQLNWLDKKKLKGV